MRSVPGVWGMVLPQPKGVEIRAEVVQPSQDGSSIRPQMRVMLCAVVDEVLHLLGSFMWDPAQQSMSRPPHSTRAHRAWHKNPACACLGHHCTSPACITRSC